MARMPDERLRQALRDNLRRRKDQTRGREEEAPDERGKSVTQPEDAPRAPPRPSEKDAS